MNSAIKPETAQSSATQAFEQSDRNPVVSNLIGADNGGQMPTPLSADSRVTQPGPVVSPNAGLQDYDMDDSADNVQDEAEREG